jgi:peptidyl-prolyl cis-trans isomerase B (cyclophilin B)
MPIAPSEMEVAATRARGRYLATITMANDAVIELVLDGKEAPLTVANFVKLAESGFYDNVSFHRVEPGFVIQGGDPDGTGRGGPGYTIALEIAPSLRHYEGAVSMARTAQPDTAGSQFFICLGDANFLDKQYAVFGWVKSGSDVVQAVRPNDRMKRVTVTPYEGEEASPITAR